MAFLNWFKSDKDQNDDINVTKVPQKSIDDGAMASSGGAAAAEQLAEVLSQQQADPQILVVGTEAFSANLQEYALKMGQRLDCQIIAVNATTLPLTFSDAQREKAASDFYASATKAGEKFSELASSIGVSFTHQMEIDNEDHIIQEVAAKNPGVRYVLTEPDPTTSDNQHSAQIPVFDLACSRL